jgi:hypothetical protein
MCNGPKWIGDYNRTNIDARRVAMLVRMLSLVMLIAVSPLLMGVAEATDVMVVGMFHMGNPSRDLHDVHADDVLAPKRQAEMAVIVAGLAQFRPTEVDVELPSAVAAQRYDAFVKRKLPPSRDESVQLGFRLAQISGAALHGIDANGDFPYDEVEAYARSHSETELLARVDARVADDTAKEQHLLDTATIGKVLRGMNDPDQIRQGNEPYSMMLKLGSGADQPGADLLAAWYRRNMHICAQMVQLANHGDRIVVMFGAGHAFLLRRCVSDMPGYALIEPNRYLPK